jgi:hypothetical protein
MSNALIVNPHMVVRWHHQQGTPGLTEASFTSLIEWALDIGTDDMDPSTPVWTPPTPPAPLPADPAEELL